MKYDRQAYTLNSAEDSEREWDRVGSLTVCLIYVDPKLVPDPVPNVLAGI